MDFIGFFQHLLDPEKLIYTGGLLIILLVIFTENGLFFGFFLPGDTLLFTAGLLCATNSFDVPIYILLITICIAAICGNLFGYYFGKKVGQNFLLKKESILFKRKYVYAAEIFFNKYGGMALIMGRFLPIVRTFAPIFAGMISFNFRKFIAYNILGGILWVFSMLLAGYFLGIVYPEIKNKLEYVIGGIVVVTWTPVIIAYLREKVKTKNSGTVS